MLGIIIIIFLLMQVAVFLFVPTLLGAVFMKKCISNMNEEKWDLYFQSMTSKGLIVRVLILLFIPLAFCSGIGYHIFQFFHKDKKKSLRLAFATFLIGSIRIIYKIQKHKKELLELCNNFHETTLKVKN